MASLTTRFKYEMLYLIYFFFLFRSFSKTYVIDMYMSQYIKNYVNTNKTEKMSDIFIK